MIKNTRKRKGNFLFRVPTVKSNQGFSLIEVIIVLVIIGILAAIAIPGFMKWVPNFRLKGAARDLYSTMQKARLEAVKRNTNIGIVFSTVVFPAIGGNYQVFVDDGDDGTGTIIIANRGNAQLDAGELPLFQNYMPASCSLIVADFGSTNDIRTGYNSQGLPLGNRIGSVQLRNDQSRWYKHSLSNSGHVRLEMSADGVNWN